MDDSTRGCFRFPDRLLTPLAAGLLLFAATACEPTYRLYEVVEAGDVRTDSLPADTTRLVGVHLTFGYPVDAGAVVTVTNRSERSLLLDVANSQVVMDGHAMRLLDGPDLAFDGIGPELRFSGEAVTPRDGILYPQIGPRTAMAFPVPALRLGGCAGTSEAHCGRYDFKFIVEADERRPEARITRVIDALATPGDKVSAYRAKYPPAKTGTYLVQTSAGGDGSGAAVLMGIVIPIVIAAAVSADEEE